MDPVERAAHVSVGRACAFCGLTIFCFMAGFSFDPHLSARFGGMVALVVAIVLMMKAYVAPTKPYKQTEVWLILNEDEKPAPENAQALIGGILRRVFIEYARYCAFAAAALLATSALFRLLFE